MTVFHPEYIALTQHVMFAGSGMTGTIDNDLVSGSMSCCGLMSMSASRAKSDRVKSGITDRSKGFLLFHSP